MSIQTEVTRITEARDTIRTKLVALNLAEETDKIDALASAIEGIEDRKGGGGSISTKSGSVSIPAGYYDGTGSVTISSTEQGKIIPDNIKQGISILGVTGTYEGAGARLQSKSVTPSDEEQSVTADSGYDGLSQVTVKAIPDTYIEKAGTATAADVLQGKTFINASGSSTGTMVNAAAKSYTLGLTKESETITAGYYNGSGTVSIDDSIETALAAI